MAAARILKSAAAFTLLVLLALTGGMTYVQHSGKFFIGQVGSISANLPSGVYDGEATVQLVDGEQAVVAAVVDGQVPSVTETAMSTNGDMPELVTNPVLQAAGLTPVWAPALLAAVAALAVFLAWRSPRLDRRGLL